MFSTRLLRSLALGSMLAGAAMAVVAPRPDDPLLEKVFRDPDVYIPNLHRSLGTPSLAAALAPEQVTGLTAELAALGVDLEHGFYDTRGGAWGSLTLARPLLPGPGAGNTLQWSDLGRRPPADDATLKAAAWAELQSFLTQHQAQLEVPLGELADPNVSVIDGGAIIQINARRQIGGIPVRDSYVMGFINRGNLVLYGTRNWGPMNAAAAPAVSAAAAEATVAAHLAPFTIASFRGPTHLEIVPTAATQLLDLDPVGAGYDYRLAWVVSVKVTGDRGSWEGLVDATTGALLLFTDVNHYATVRRVSGGVLPVSNDGLVPDGVEQPGYPMPFADILLPDDSTTYTTSGGALGCVDGSIKTTLSGKYVKMNDNCGAVDETSAGDINLAQGPGTDCAVPPGHSAGDTHATRTGFYEVNRLIEQGRGWLPDNAWLTEQLPVNMNIDDTCNAFWDGGSINFYRSGGGCSNTGELAGVFDHEWGHGLDANDNNTGVSSPGEAIADVHGFLKLNNSCLGRNFQPGQACAGYGDTCSGTPVCTGVRDGDFANHRCESPHDIRWINQPWDPLGITPCDPVTGTAGGCVGVPGNPPVPQLGPCGQETHCEGYVPAEAAWDVYKRDLQAPPFSFDTNTALELATRIAYIGGSFVGNWYQCTGPVGDGCNADSGYKTALAADDDDGDITNGTPHATAIYNAYNRHQIACDPVPVNSGCAAGPTTAPAPSAAGIDQGAILTWPAVAGANEYWIFRTEGVFGCDFGKVKVGETDTLSFTDQGLQNGTTYFYTVLPVGANTACFGRMSACTSVVPVSGANLRFEESVDFDVAGGDADVFLDNCETGQLTFTAQANGTQPLTNVRVTSVTSTPPLVFAPATPIPIAASLPPCGEANLTINFAAAGLTFDQSIDVEIEITADEIFPQTRTLSYTIANAESSFTATATKTWSFEPDFEGWKVLGTFTRDTGVGGGAPPTATYLQSSVALDSQCDRAQSPVVRLSGTSALSLWSAFNIEPTTTMAYDRANVGMIDLDHPAQPRTTILPSGGVAYTIPAPAPGGACVTTGQAGWNGTSVGYPALLESTWTPASLNPGGALTGKRALIDVAYGTDGAAALAGFRFDHVTLTNFELQEADAQSDACGGGNLPPIALADAAMTLEDQPVDIDVLENDSDPDGDPAPADTLTISAISDPPHGTATLDAGGPGPADDTILYTPDICSFGTDLFTYTVTDSGAPPLSAIGTVSVDVIGSAGACFTTVTPCRIYDSRDGDPFTSGTPRDIQIADLCGIPPSALAVSLNVTVVGPTGAGHLKIYPGTTEPETSTINFGPGQTRANNAIASILGGVLRVKTFQVDGGTVDVVIDVNGYTERVPN